MPPNPELRTAEPVVVEPAAVEPATAEPAAVEPEPLGYADRFAADYDRWFGKPDVTGATVETLAGLAGAGRVLELGIGTGRVAVPLRARGLDVHGVEASEPMLRRLRGKPGGAEIPVTVADFADVDAPGAFDLIFLAGGTFFELTDGHTQQRCFVNAARRLTPDGVFVLDAHLPEALAVTVASGIPQVVADTEERLILCHRSIDPSTQSYHSHYLIHEGERTHRVRVAFRYASPGELDLMAEHAGLRLRTRLGSWTGAPFGRDSAYHVSVYERARRGGTP